jgi:imidazolonepropionase-like amidohydrolase
MIERLAIRRRPLPGAAAALFLGALSALTAPVLHADVVVITGAQIQTMGPEGVIPDGTLVIENGRIKAVGRSAAVPAGARHIDAHGKVVTPGLLDSATHLGVVEVNQVQGTGDANDQDDRVTAAFNVADAFNPRSTLIPVNRIEGLTRAVVVPESGKSLIAGLGSVVHLGGTADSLVRTPVAMFASFGERGAELSGGSRAGALLRLREAFQDARDYAANKKAFDAAQRRPYTLSRLDLEALLPVVRGELPLVVRVQRASDIETMLRLAREEKIKLILAGATEAWKVAGQIAAAKVPVLINPLDNLPNDFESLGATLENAARLNRAGVTIAFMTGEAHNSRNLRQGAGNAVSYGLPWNVALAAMTSTPAKIWGIDSSYGTLEAGKDADVVIWDGDPLELTTYPEKVFIKGVDIPMRSRQTDLRDRYKDLKSPVPPVYRHP